jgi:large subunit ribosomal protein L19
VRVHVKVREGDKERIQIFEGVVIGMHRGRHARVLHGAQGVVRPGRGAHLPAALADDSEGRGDAVGQVRRAKLYYLRDLKGKAARMKEGRARGGKLRCQAKV